MRMPYTRRFALALLMLAGFLIAVLLVVVRTPRCHRCKRKMAMLDELADDAYPAESEQVEERIGSVDHQIWVCPACCERKKRRFLRPYLLGLQKLSGMLHPDPAVHLQHDRGGHLHARREGAGRRDVRELLV